VRWWKVVGLAGLAGVTATGVAVARAERQRRAYTPEDVRARLHARLERLPPEPSAGDAAADDDLTAQDSCGPLGRVWRRLRRVAAGLQERLGRGRRGVRRPAAGP